MSGSLYLGIRNICGAGLSHENLDQPISIGEGFKKGIFGFSHEIKDGITGIWYVPRDRVVK